MLAQHLAENPVQSEFVPGSGGDGWSPTTKVQIPPAPEMTPVLVGDIIHNIRTSLDHLASEMARLKGKPDKNVYFPFAENAGALDEMIKKKNFTYCGVDAVALLRALKPYKQGNLELRAIHDLDILDKHRDLLPEPHLKSGSVKGMEWTGPPVDGRRPFRWVPVELKDVTYVFPPGSALEKRPLVDALRELVDLCEGILDSFARHFP
jgi:hypothetical protein